MKKMLKKIKKKRNGSALLKIFPCAQRLSNVQGDGAGMGPGGGKMPGHVSKGKAS